MSNVINFAVEIDSSKKDVAIKAMALIAAMAEISMLEMANCIDGIEVSDPKEVSSTRNTPIGATKDAPLVLKGDEPEETQEEEKPKKKRKSRNKKAEDDGPAAVEVEEKKVDRPDSAVDAYEAKKAKEKAGKKDDVTVEDIRAKLKDLVLNHRDAIKAKLTELGAASASTLSEDKYAEMYEYLEGLK